MGISLYSLLVLVGGVTTSVLACSCRRSHPQTTFCNVDFVFKGWLRSDASEPADDSMYKKYEVLVRKVYKASHNDFGFNENTTVATLYTSSFGESVCGVEHLEKRVKYLFAGFYSDGHLGIDICNTIGAGYPGGPMPWAWVSKMQRKYMRRIYGESCDCQVSDNYDYNLNSPNSGNDTCMWNPRGTHSDCYERQTACIKDKNSHLGECKWLNNPKLKACKQGKSSGFLEP